VTRVLARYLVVALLALVALWAFVCCLQPAFTGDRAPALLLCG
jgi:hypothetical protein